MSQRTTQQETLDGPQNAQAGERARVVCLTILHHPDPSRVGERATLRELARSPAALSRLEPAFAPPGGGEASALRDPFVSRRASAIVMDGDGVRWTRGEHGSGMLAEGLPVASTARFAREQLERGVVLELAQRVVLLLHTRGPDRAALPRCGLVGESEAIDRVRAAIGQVADLDVPVLLRGESGTGKELVARAIHAASPRASGAMVAVNMAAVSPTVAASELFGHVRGAFTGAVRDHAGAWRSADGGTLFLDEIGDTPADVQAMLLRAIETGEISPVGGTRPSQVSVRLITATDVDLERAVGHGAFKSSLLHRLAGFQIPIPPLRDRRDDVARLFYVFLAEELARVGMSDRLITKDDPEAPSWLPAEVVSRLVRYDWPGNVRQLRNVARQIVLGSRGEPHAHIDASVELALAQPRVIQPEPAPHEAVKRRPSDIDRDELIEALRACKWKLGPTAERLGISRSSLYDLIDRTPEIRRAGDVTRGEIERAIAEVGGDADALAEHLSVSPRGLKLRMKELGL
jgi:two-component system nitrogen regulation response regulator GlnG